MQGPGRGCSVANLESLAKSLDYLQATLFGSHWHPTWVGLRTKAGADHVDRVLQSSMSQETRLLA